MIHGLHKIDLYGGVLSRYLLAHTIFLPMFQYFPFLLSFSLTYRSNILSASFLSFVFPYRSNMQTAFNWHVQKDHKWHQGYVYLQQLKRPATKSGCGAVTGRVAPQTIHQSLSSGSKASRRRSQPVNALVAARGFSGAV